MTSSYGLEIFITVASSVITIAMASNLVAQTTEAAAVQSEENPVVLVKTADIHSLFDKAKTAFVKGDSKVSAAAISEAANMVSQQQSVAAEAYTAPLAQAAASLNVLAKSVGVGEVNDVKEIDQTFANVHQTLAEFYQGKAQRAYDAGDKNAAAKAMEAAANHVENGAKWAGTTLSDTAKGTVSLLRKVSSGILSGTGSSVEKVGDVLGKGTKTITGLGAKIRNTDAAPEANAAEKAVKGTQGAAGGAVEGAGQAKERASDAVSDTGKGLKKLGEGEKKPEEPKKDL